jgi:hypothetical protein
MKNRVLQPRDKLPWLFSTKELSATEVDSWIHKVLDVGVNPNPRVGPAPLQDGVARASISTLGFISVAYAIMSFHCTCDLA